MREDLSPLVRERLQSVGIFGVGLLFREGAMVTGAMVAFVVASDRKENVEISCNRAHS